MPPPRYYYGTRHPAFHQAVGSSWSWRTMVVVAAAGLVGIAAGGVGAFAVVDALMSPPRQAQGLHAEQALHAEDVQAQADMAANGIKPIRTITAGAPDPTAGITPGVSPPAPLQQAQSPQPGQAQITPVADPPTPWPDALSRSHGAVPSIPGPAAAVPAPPETSPPAETVRAAAPPKTYAAKPYRAPRPVTAPIGTTSAGHPPIYDYWNGRDRARPDDVNDDDSVGRSDGAALSGLKPPRASHAKSYRGDSYHRDTYRRDQNDGWND